MVGENVRSRQRAIESLTKAEDNSEANRAAYLEIHGTLETVRSNLHRQHNVLLKVLKFFHLVP